MRKLTFVMVEAALELVPVEISHHPAVVSYARRRGKDPTEVLLDRSYHHAAMLRLEKSWKRGRPDIVHFTLLEVLGSPLNRSKYVETYVEAQSGHVIYIDPETRLPRTYERFKGLIEKLYREPVVEFHGKTLLRLEKGGLKEISDKVKPDIRILLSEKGSRLRWRELAERILEHDRPMVMLGAFPKGDFEEETRMNADLEVSIWDQPLESWIVASRVLTMVEYLMLEVG